ALRIAEIDIDANEPLARSFAVEAVPTLVLLSADSRIVSRHTGYLDAAELMKWLAEGRVRAKAGQWEGTAPSSKVDALIAKAAGDGLDTNDLARLIALLGEQDPGERAAVMKLILAQREQAMPALITALGDSYLGVRLGAGELLQRLAPGATALHPGQGPRELTHMIGSLPKRGSATGKLPSLPSPAARPVDASVQDSINGALEDLRGDDLARRTEAMSTLVAHGSAALPVVREAIRKYERGEPRLVALLEDVRW